MPKRYTELRRNALAILLVGVLFAFGAFVFIRQVTNDASPVRSVDALGATIRSVQWGKGSPTIYVLFLDSGATVLANDNRPHPIGSHANIERVTRDNGFVFYRFPE
ncbi:hypothetical protein EH240_00230 [Mesorhizobium tamadayense]|uniref:Uncharacterized protein n=1 Tax=Mesorhizobium tamadayense TaxID=425306 RepID=A0A3P3GCE8_9HYPH|nr:hypothetical protein [Mesorhizobium tamadayense]RRI07709.1 hypothetical protein EH240_00230 [Mesorhizobium tamadayense]